MLFRPTSGNLLKIKDDIALVKPTQIISVPTLYNRMLQGIVDALGGEENTRKLIEANSPILNKVREGFGGRVKWMLSGSAPINTKVIELLGKIMGCPFSEAYGQTENTGGAFIQNLNEN